MLGHSPGEAACPKVDKCTDSSAQGGDKACDGGERVHCHARGGEVKSDLLSQE